MSPTTVNHLKDKEGIVESKVAGQWIFKVDNFNL